MSEWLSSKNQQVTSVGEDVGGKEPSHTVDGTANWHSHYEKLYGEFFRNVKIEPPYDPAIPHLGIHHFYLSSKLIYFPLLNQLCIPGMKPTLSNFIFFFYIFRFTYYHFV